MDSLKTTVVDSRNPTEPVTLNTIANVNETMDSLIIRHDQDLAELRLSLANPIP